LNTQNWQWSCTRQYGLPGVVGKTTRHGFRNGMCPPIGYRIVAAEQRGSETTKKLEIGPMHA
jgi:hypothetical protein